MRDPSTVTALVLAAEQGDEGAWKALVDRYTPLVLSVMRGLVLRPDDIEAVTGMVWLRLVRHLGKLREPRTLAGWLVTTTRDECLIQLRTSQRTGQRDPAADLDRWLSRTGRQQALLAAFAELREQQRELLLLLAADPPVRYSEISRRLGVPIGSIGPTRARALQKLWRGSFPGDRWMPGPGSGTKGGYGR